MQLQARNNTEMSLIVEQGITRDLLHGSVMAWTFLAANKVPNAVILRVLADPANRRDTDLPSVSLPRLRILAEAAATSQVLSD